MYANNGEGLEPRRLGPLNLDIEILKVANKFKNKNKRRRRLLSSS